MKKNIYLIIMMLGLFSFFACEDDSPIITIKENVTANVLENLTSSNYVLSLDNATSTFETFEWTAPDYGFDAAINYILQADLASNNFSSPIEVLITEGLTTGTIKVGDFNKKLLNAGLEPDVAQAMKFRVVAVINSEVDTVYSNAVTANVTPYATSFPPVYMIGDALPGGWDLGLAVEMRSSAPSVYSTIGHFENGKIFRFFATPSWSATQYNYSWFTTVDSDLELNANDGDKNFKVVGATGYYSISVNLKTKTVSMEPVAEPKMYMIGSAVPSGWSTDNAIKMTWKSNGIFEATTTFTNAGIFRFFNDASWSATQYNYSTFPAGSVYNLFELNAGDGDKNLKFIGTTGTYKITLNLLDLKVTMLAAK